MKDWGWKYFLPEEVLSPIGLKRLKDSGLLLIQPVLLDKLTELRERLNDALFINHGNHWLRGYRSPEENMMVDGTPQSLHLQGLAVDVTAKAISLRDLADAAIIAGFTGIGFYPKKNFIHMDLRTNLYQRITRWEEV